MSENTYAVLGATGQTGSELTKYLTSRNDGRLNLYARSRFKINFLVSNLSPNANPKVTLFIGSIDDTSLLTSCIRNTQVIFATVAQNHNDPECSIARRSAHSIIEALNILKREAGGGFVCPTVVFLSSGSMDPTLSLQIPAWGRWLSNQAFGYIYSDLRLAFLQFSSHPWIPLMQAEPGMIVTDIARGFSLGGDQLSPMVSYADLARGMVAMAEEDGGNRWKGQLVPVSSTGGKDIQSNALEIVCSYALPGLMASWAPSLWRFGRRRRWWGC